MRFLRVLRNARYGTGNNRQIGTQRFPDFQRFRTDFFSIASCEAPNGSGKELFDLNYVVAHVCIYMEWKPLDCEGLFLDREDCFGLLWWYDYVLPQMKRDMNGKKK